MSGIIEVKATPANAGEVPTSLEQRAAPSNRPEDVPEKFWDAEKGEVRQADLLKSYKELERRGGTDPEVEAATPEAEAEATPGQEVPTTEEAAAPNQRGLIDKYTKVYLEAGELGDEAYADLEAQGWSRDVVDAHIAGQEAIATIRASALQTAVGGEEGVQKALEWAQLNMSEDERTSFNAAVNGPDNAAALKAIEGLAASYNATTSSPPKNQIEGNGPPTSSGNTYTSFSEWLSDMADPRYTSNDTFRAAVDAKHARSNI